MLVWADIEKRHGELKTLRAMEEPAWRDLSRALEEDGGGGFDVRSPPKDRSGADSLDSTPLYAKDDFVGGLFTEAVNPIDRWFELGLEDKDLQKWGPVKKWLWGFTNTVYASIDPNAASFYIEASPWFSDKAAFGTGFLGQEEGQRSRIIDRALPIREMFKDVDADGVTNRIHREFMLTGLQAKAKFGERAPSMRDDEQALFVHALYQNDNYRPGMLGNAGKPWLSCYASPDKRDFSSEGGYYELPIHEIEWKRRSGRAWATGPGHKARADFVMLDEMQRSTLTALQFAAEPIHLVQNEDIMTAADMQPAAVLYGGINENGKRQVDVLERGENLHLPMTAIAQLQNSIREAFYFTLFQLINRPQMTATEFLGFKEEKLRLLAPHLVCVHRGLAGFIARRASILMRQQRIPPPPPELANQVIRPAFVSPFAQAQKSTKARQAMQIGTSAMGLLQLNPEISDNIDTDALMRSIADGMSSDPALVRDPRVVAQIRAGRAEQQAPDIALARQAQQADIVATVSHAEQASTRAAQRGGKAA